MKINAMIADITTLKVDAIVNAANAELARGGGVCGSIYKAAGAELDAASAALAPCPPGQARITPGFRLPAKYIIHAVGPIWSGGKSNEDELLASAYTESLLVADSHDVVSIAFPAISTGIYGFPLARATSIAVDAVKALQPTLRTVRQVTFACFSDDVLQAYRNAGVAA